MEELDIGNVETAIIPTVVETSGMKNCGTFNTRLM